MPLHRRSATALTLPRLLLRIIADAAAAVRNGKPRVRWSGDGARHRARIELRAAPGFAEQPIPRFATATISPVAEKTQVCMGGAASYCKVPNDSNPLAPRHLSNY